MFARLLALFLLTPVVELALLIQLGDLIGFWPTVGIILVTGFTGTYLAKREGLSAWRRLRAQIDRGGLPGQELLDGVIILIAGALLITPGVLTDVTGFIGLLPFTRAPIRRYVMKRITRAVEKGTLGVSFGSFGSASWDAMSGPPPGTAAPDDDPVEERWQGRPQDRPGYREHGDDAR